MGMFSTRRRPLWAAVRRLGKPPAELVLSLASQGVRSSIVRLPPTTHGDGDHGFMAALVRIAARRASPATSVTGPTAGRRAPTRCCAPLLPGLEKAQAASTLHAVADEGVPIRDIAESSDVTSTCPWSPFPPSANEHFGFLGGFLRLDVPARAR